jgi:hypothetical protein
LETGRETIVLGNLESRSSQRKGIENAENCNRTPTGNGKLESLSSQRNGIEIAENSNRTPSNKREKLFSFSLFSLQRVKDKLYG